MRLLFFILFLLNALVLSMGAGWLGTVPSEVEYKSNMAKPTEYKPQEVHIVKKEIKKEKE